MKRAIIITTILLAAGAAVFGLLPRSHTRSEFLMDTLINIKIQGNVRAMDAAFDYLTRLDESINVHNPDSALSRYNDGQAIELSPDVAALIDTAATLSQRTGRIFNHNLYPLSRLWGIGTPNARVPSPDEISQALERQALDLGGIAKGWASDRVFEILRTHGVDSALVDMGGNIGALGTNGGKPWRIGIRDPLDEQGGYIGILEARDEFVVTSGGYERYFEQDGVRYHHILDPRTGYPSNSGLLSVTIIADNCAVADALSTALFILGREQGLELIKAFENVNAILIEENHSVTMTDGVRNRFRTCVQ